MILDLCIFLKKNLHTIASKLVSSIKALCGFIVLYHFFGGGGFKRYYELVHLGPILIGLFEESGQLKFRESSRTEVCMQTVECLSL